jgi:hypothetical protein
MIKEKRIKSQAQTQNFDDALNFTSINRINKQAVAFMGKEEKEAKDIESLKENKVRSRIISMGSGSNVMQYESKGCVENEIMGNEGYGKEQGYDEEGFMDIRLHIGDLEEGKDLQGHHQEFMNENSGNIYCKKIEDFCGDCVLVLETIKRQCETCSIDSGLKQRSKGGSSFKSGKSSMSRNPTCLNCWNRLSQYAENCLNCNEDLNHRSRNITFASKILIKKKEDDNNIGMTLVDFDQKIDTQSENEKEYSPHKKQKSQKDGNENNMMESKMLSNQEIFDEFHWKEKNNFIGQEHHESENKKDLSIHIPGQDFSLEDSSKKVVKKIKKK